MARGAEGLIGPKHIFDGDGGAIRESGLGAQGEFDPSAVVVRLDRFGQKTVERERFVPGPTHQGLVGEVGQLPRRIAAQDEGIERIKAPHVAGDDRAAPRCVRVGIGERHKIRWERRGAIHSYAMRRGGTRLRGRASKDDRGQSSPQVAEKF